MLPHPRTTSLLTSHAPTGAILEFLAPRLALQPRLLSSSSSRSRQRRYLSTSPPQLTTTQYQASSSPSQSSHEPPSHTSKSSSSTTAKPLTQAQRDFLSSALRVNQAGELAATLIYAAQTPPIVTAHPHLRPLMAHMSAQETSHFHTFNALLSRHRVRPTAMYPLWTIFATGLGWSTAILGREAAMACMEAVETEIGDHYNSQIRGLLEMAGEMEAQGQEMGPELRELIDTIRRIRDEELEHLDHAVGNDAKMAVPHELLTGVIRAGCRGAIWISERV